MRKHKRKRAGERAKCTTGCRRQEAGGWSPLCFTNEQLIYMKQRVPAARATQKSGGRGKGEKRVRGKRGKTGEGEADERFTKEAY